MHVLQLWRRIPTDATLFGVTIREGGPSEVLPESAVDASSEPWPTVTDEERRIAAVLLLVVAAITVLYWVLWFSDRGSVASETTSAYYQFENAFPLADGWWVLTLLGAAWSLNKKRPAALGWLLVAGGAGLYLFGMDVLYDAEHGIWTKGSGGIIEAVINVATLVINAVVLRWAWTRRAALLEPGRVP